MTTSPRRPARHPALDSWGEFDRDDPFPLFAQVRSAAPVHEVTLADGHAAWLVVGHDEARAALNHPRLSKDMHAALAHSGQVVAEGLPGPALARHMLGVDPPDHTRLRRLAMPAFTRRRVEGLQGRVTAIVAHLLAGLTGRGPDQPVDLVAGYAFPLPFTVISELLGIPEPDRDDLGRWFRTLLTPSAGPQPPAAAVAASDAIVGYLTALLHLKRTAPGEDLVTDLVVAADRDGAATEQEMLSTIFQLVVAGHDTTTSLIGNATVALLRHPAQRDALIADPGLIHARGRGVPALGRAGTALDLPLHDRGGPHRRGRDPAVRPGHHLLGGREPGPRPLPRRGGVRHPPGRRRAPRLRPRHPPLPGRAARPDAGPHRARHAAPAVPDHAPRRRHVRTALGSRGRAGAARAHRAPSAPWAGVRDLIAPAPDGDRPAAHLRSDHDHRGHAVAAGGA